MTTNSRRLGGLVDEGRGTVRVTKPSVFVALALLSGSLMVVNSAPAQAAYPGDNGRIVVVGDGGHGTWDVITMNADGTDRVNLTQGAFDTEFPVWSPDGTRIAFSSVVGSPSGCRTGDIYVMNADGSDMTPLTTNPFGIAAYDPTWSPDGSEIAFTREHSDATCTSGDIDIWKMNSDGSGQVLLTSGANPFGPAYDAEPAWSPDGDRIAFRSDRANADWSDSDQIYTMDPDGSNITQVTHQELNTFESNFKPAWSPDGEQIAFERHQFFPDPPSSQATSQIWRINEDGTGETAVTANGFTANMDPAWSPDGQRILFANHVEKPTGFDNDIYAINPDGTDQVNVTNTDSPEVHPDWQPLVAPTSPGANGKIAFAAPGPGATFDIWTMNPDGTDMTAVTNLGQDVDFPAWTPDGTKIAFSTVVGSPSGCNFGEIYVVNADGSNLTQLTSTSDVIESDPTWSPDGMRIAYSATTQDATCSSGQEALRIMNADGSGQTAITAPPVGKFDTEPAWSPTGSTIAFTSNRPGPSGSGKPDIWLVQADGSGLTQLTNSVGTFFRSLSPTWSPDGQRVAFERPNSFFGGSNIWYVGADGTGMTQVTNQSFVTFQPAWSPDGEQIVYLGQDTCCDGLDLWVVDIDTAAMTQLTDGLAVARPDWQPAVEPSPVAPPSFTGTDPVSPANNNNPRILGTAVGAVTVTLYETADCSGPAAVQGTVADFASPGLQVSVPDNSTTTFYGTATDDAANISACSASSITYVEDSVPADPECSDGLDNDRDGFTDLDDPGCADAADLDEKRPTLPCDDGADNDGDGAIDFLALGGGDLGCVSPISISENPQCQDGINNDGDTGIDFDGGDSLDIDPRDGLIDVEFNPVTPSVGDADLQCIGNPSKRRETSGGCGLGAELALVIPLLGLAASRRRRASCAVEGELASPTGIEKCAMGTQQRR